MEKTLKERAELALKTWEERLFDSLSATNMYETRTEDYVFDIIRDQQARIEELEKELKTVQWHYDDVNKMCGGFMNVQTELKNKIKELEAKTQWKPIADMPEELKDGRWILIKGATYATVSVQWNKKDRVFKTISLGWYGKDTVTHYMEIPE